MDHSRTTRLAGLAIGLLLAWQGFAQAETVEQFYKGKTLTLIISAAPGGGTDFYGRQFAPFLAKHLPGHPNVIVTNLPGASGLRAAMQLQTQEPRDGTVVAFLQRNNLDLPLVSDHKIVFDPRKVTWIGSLNKEIYTVIAMADSPAKTTDDLFKKTVTIGATSLANENRTLPAMMNKYFGTKFHIVLGYSGSNAIHLAMLRGEVQARMQTVDSLLSYGNEREWLKQGKINVLLQTAIKPSPKFPNAPSIFEFTKDPKAIAVAKFMLSPMEAGRPFAIPPGVPQDCVAALREAFDAAAKDPEFVAEMKKVGAVPEPISGQEVEDIVNELYSAPQSVRDNVRQLINQR